jgi:CRISPR-associated protein Csc1
MPQIYCCELHLLEQTFFSTREISNLYQTEAFIGHIALCYALGLTPSRYYNNGKTIHYREDLDILNQRGIYITPATIQGSASFNLGQFNAQPESYWSAMGNNALITAPEGMWAEKEGNSWYLTDGGSRRKHGVENRPQFGRIRTLSAGNRAIFFVISQEELELPSYIRLGKWMSKARIQTKPMQIKGEQKEGKVPFLLAPADLAKTARLLACDLLNVAPTPLARNIWLIGDCYDLGQNTLLPKDMRFNLEGFR